MYISFTSPIHSNIYSLKDLGVAAITIEVVSPYGTALGHRQFELSNMPSILHPGQIPSSSRNTVLCGALVLR